MPAEQFKAEVDAIGAVLQHLEPLTAAARQRVLDYVLRAFGMSPIDGREPAGGEDLLADQGSGPNTSTPADNGLGTRQDIRSLHDEKQPKTSIEMAALVGYYLSELASPEEHKDAIETADLQRLFKQARHPLPSRIKNTLGLAAAAGYFDLVDRGRYRLNPVGHNLVVHNLPSDGSNGQPRRRAAKKIATKKTTAAKTTTVKKTTAKKAAKKAAAEKSVS